jgi:hypothetical protein
MFESDDFFNPISIALADTLIHENQDTFIEAALPAVLSANSDDLMVSSEAEGRLLLQSLFSALPLSSNHFRFASLEMPGRNDPCPCGSGKKFKKCCAHLNALDLPPSEALFMMALESLSPEQIQLVLNKPNWTLKAFNCFVPLLMDLQQFDAVLYFYEAHLGSLKALRNEHEMLVSCILDAMFELRLDEKRFQLMESLTKLTQAKSLQSIAHQRLAMINAQDGNVASAKSHLQKAMRADPNQVELPMAEISILGLIADDDELISRAKYWRARLSKRYEDDYPPIGVMEDVIAQGKDYFTAMMPDGLDWDDDDSDQIVELNVDNLLGSLLSSEYVPLYDYKYTDGEAKLVLNKVPGTSVKQWMIHFELQRVQCLELVDESELPPWLTKDDAALLKLWELEDSGWIKALWDEPELLSSIEVINTLSPLVNISPLLFEGLEEEFDDADSSPMDPLIFALMDRQQNIVDHILGELKKHKLTLPARFKANKKFWESAQDYYLFLNGLVETQKLIQDLLSGLVDADPAQGGWLDDAVVTNYFTQRLSGKVISFLADKRKLSVTSGLILACAQQDKGMKNESIETLVMLAKRQRKLLVSFKSALESNEFSKSAPIGLMPFHNLLNDELLEDYKEWLLRNLPDK